MDRGAWRGTVHGIEKRHGWVTFTLHWITSEVSAGPKCLEPWNLELLYPFCCFVEWVQGGNIWILCTGFDYLISRTTFMSDLEIKTCRGKMEARNEQCGKHLVSALLLLSWVQLFATQWTARLYANMAREITLVAWGSFSKFNVLMNQLASF